MHRRNSNEIQCIWKNILNYSYVDACICDDICNICDSEC